MAIWVEMRKHFAARMAEWLNAFYLLSWGVYVLTHPGMMKSTPIFHGMIDIAAQPYWGIGASVVGGVRVVALWINGRWHVTPAIRVATSFCSVFVWFWVAIGLLKSGLPQTGLVIYPGLMIADMISAFRAASDVYEAEATRRLKIMAESSGGAGSSSRG